MRYLLILLILPCFFTANVVAHHGFGGEYNRSQPIYLSGVVKSVYFGYPHATLTLNTVAAKQSVDLPENAQEFKQGLTFWKETSQTIKVEFPPVGKFFALENRVNIGDNIAIIALKNCEPPHQLRGQWILLSSNESIVRSGVMQNEVDHCH